MAQAPVITSLDPNRGAFSESEFTYVLIHGQHLGGVTEITFGGVSSGMIASDETLAVALMPPGTGVVDIRVTTPNGTSVPSAASRFTYASPPVITSVVVEPGSSGVTIYGYNLFNITGVGFDNGGAFLFDRNDQPDSPGTSLFAAWSAVNAPTGTVNVSVTAMGGTASGSGRFPTAPTVSTLSPISGSTAGDTTVTLSGDDFVAGSTSVVIGGTVIPAASVTVNSATSLSFTTPAHAAGNAAVTVTSPNGTSGAVPGGFTYVAANPPVITSMSANRAPAGEGDPTYVVLYGTGLEGVTAVTFGGVNATMFGLGTDGSLAAGAPAQGEGVVDIQVVTPEGASAPSPVSRFTYVGPPTITSVVVNLSLERVEIHGTNLFGIFSVDINGADASQFTRNNESDATGTTAFAYWDRRYVPSGSAAVRVFALGGRADATGYLAAMPTLSAITPSTGPAAGGTSVTLTGTDFVAGSTSVSIGVATIPATEVTVASATSLSFTTPAHLAGNVAVTATTPTGASNAVAGGFTYVSANAPVVGSVGPSRGFVSESVILYVVIYGSNIQDATGVTFGGVSSDLVAWSDYGQFLMAMAPAGTGTVDVQVITPNGTSAPSSASKFTYLGSPVITSVDVHPEWSGVEIHGSNLFSISSVVFDNGEAAFIADRNTDDSSTGTSVRASWSLISPPSGTVNVTVYAAGGAATGTGYALSMPTLAAISPAGGSTAGGTAVTLTGTNFIAGATSVMIGSTVIPAESVTVNSATSLSFTSPANAAGNVGVTVRTPNGTSGAAPGGFTYGVVIAAPTLASISPSSGPAAGGTSVTLTGTNFIAGSTSVSIGGTVIPASSVIVDSATSLTFVTPAHAAGRVDVTVTTPEGTAGPVPGGFTYDAQAPTADPVSATVTYGSADNPITLRLAGGPADSVEVVVQAVNGVAVATGTAITYTPNAGYVGSDSFTYRAINAAGASAAALVSLTVSPPTPPTATPLTTSPVAYNAGAATATTFTVVATGDPTRYAVGASASGAVVSITDAGEVAYTPPVGFRGDDNFTFTATNPGGTSSPATVTVPVNDPVFSGTLPSGAGTVGAVYNGGGVAVAFTGGAAPYRNFSATGLPAGLIISSSGVISGTPTTATNATVIITVTDSSAGAGAFTDAVSIPLIISAPAIVLSPSSGALPGGLAGLAYSETVTANGGVGPLTYAITAGALPTGLTMNGGGVISGTPTATGTYAFTVTATDNSGSAYTGVAAYSIAIVAPGITLTPGGLPVATAGDSYSQTITASGGTAPYSYSLQSGALPSGMTLSAGGVLSGTPTQSGSFPIAVRATDSTAGGAYSGTFPYTLTVSAGEQTISFGVLPNASLSASPLTLSAIATPGLSVVFVSETPAGCTVSGVTLNLLQPGTCTIRAEQAGDANWTAANPVSRSFTVTVTPDDLVVSTGGPSGAAVGDAYSQSHTVSGGMTPYSYAVSAGALPPGVSLNPTTGVVSGTPTVAGVFSYRIQVTDSQTPSVTADGAIVSAVIAKGSQTLSFISTPPSTSVSGPDYTVTVTASSGLAVVLSLDASSTGCALSGATVSFTAAGTCAINADQAGDANWNAATQVRQSFAVVASPPIAADLAGVAVTYNSTGAAIDLSNVITGGAHTAISIDSAPAHGVVTVEGDIATYGPAADYFGPDSFTWRATGPGGNSNVATVNLIVAAPAPPSVSNRVGVTVPWNDAGTAIDLSSSIMGVHSTIAISTSPSHGTATVTGSTVTYVPTPGHFGADSFAFTATGPGGTSAPATVSLTVGVPSAPTVSGLSGIAVGYNATGTAIDLSASITGVHTAITLASPPTHGSVNVDGTVVTYTPASGYHGPDSFTFTATGPGGVSTPATVSLTVATPPPPVVDAPSEPIVVPPSAGGSISVDLGQVSQGVIDGFRITAPGTHGTAELVEGGQVIPAAVGRSAATRAAAPRAVGGVQLVYTPAADFMGTDTVTVVAYGPGGDSAPVTFTFQVAGKAPDLTASITADGSVTLSPTSILVGGPFSAVRITRAPGFGTATVNGLDIVFTPGAANGGTTSLEYVIDLPFGASAAGRIELTSYLVPGAQALTAETLQGAAVTVRISDTIGGPFTGAAVVEVGPTNAGTATVAGSGATWDLTFTSAGVFSGQAVVTFSLTNAYGTTNGTLTVMVEARPDPSMNAEVRGVATAQVASARRFADAQLNNFQRRLQALHGGVNGSSNDLSLNVGFGGRADMDNDPRQALRRQLGIRDQMDPGSMEDRSRDMLGFDLWAGRNVGPLAANASTNALHAVPTASAREGGSTLGFWTAGTVDWGRQDSIGQRDYRFTTQGVTTGLDVRISDTLIIGGGLGYGEDKTRIGDNGSISDGKAWTGALYASWRPAKAFYVDGVLGFADLGFETRRWVEGLAGQPDGYAMADRSGDAIFASAAWGRLMGGGGMTTDLYARLDAREIVLDGFTETGGGLGALIWDEIQQASLSVNAGAAWRWSFDTRRHGLLRPSARLEWSHELEDVGVQGVRYADWAASPTYLVPLDAWSRNTIKIDLGAEWVLTDRLMLGLGLRSSLGDAGASHGGDIRIKYDW